IRDASVTGVQTCALPIWSPSSFSRSPPWSSAAEAARPRKPLPGRPLLTSFVPSPSAGRVFHDRLATRRAEGSANRERHRAQSAAPPGLTGPPPGEAQASLSHRSRGLAAQSAWRDSDTEVILAALERWGSDSLLR